MRKQYDPFSGAPSRSKGKHTGSFLASCCSYTGGAAKQNTSASSGMMTPMQTDIRALLESGAALTDQALQRLLPSSDQVPVSIHRAMRHSVFAGGKRLRPILCMEAARMVAKDA